MFALLTEEKNQALSQKRNKELRSLHCDLFIVGKYLVAHHLVVGGKRKKKNRVWLQSEQILMKYHPVTKQGHGFRSEELRAKHFP